MGDNSSIDLNPRRRMVEAVLADLGLEGFEFTQEERKSFDCIIRGELTTEAYRRDYLTKISGLKTENPQQFAAIGETKGFDPYVIPGTHLLKNGLEIIDPELLEEAERILTSLRMIELWENPISGKFDFDHLKSIHRHIFQDIFDWAGHQRTVTIAKGSSLFCPAENIGRYQQEIFNRLKKENNLVGQDPQTFAARAADYLSDINALHPFREGNGRTQREFLRELAQNAGYDLVLSHIPQKDMIEASIQGNYKIIVGFQRMIEENLKKSEK